MLGFSLKIPGGGGGFQKEGRGAEGRGGCLRRIGDFLGGGGRLNIFFSGPKFPPRKGAGRERCPQKSCRNFVSEIGADFECRFQYDSYGRDRAPFWPFLGEGFQSNILRPLVLPAPLLYCQFGNHLYRMLEFASVLGTIDRPDMKDTEAANRPNTND